MNKTLKTLVLFTMGFCITITTLLAQNQIPIELFGEWDNLDSLSDLQRGDCSHQSELFDSNLLWLPETNDEIKYVKVNFIFLHKDDGTGNFIQGNTEHEALINDLVTQINHVFSNLTNPAGTSCYMNEGFVSNVKVQISPNFIYIDSTKYWNNEGHPLHPDMWSGSWLDVLNSHIIENSSYSKGINIYFSENQTYYNNLVINHQILLDSPSITGGATMPSCRYIYKLSVIHMPNVFSKYYWMKNIGPIVYSPHQWEDSIRDWFIVSVGNQIAHELGHSFGLIDNMPSCNLMYGGTGIDSFMAFLTPDQIGNIHRYLSISSVRKYTTDESYLSIPYSIITDKEWDLNFTSYRDVFVESGATLTISCKLVMKSNAKIVVKPGGKLIVDGGIITTEDSKPWQGIEVWGNSSTHQSTVNGVCGQGFLELKNGAIIENAKCAVELWRPGHYSTTGGILHASDATFLNNAMAVRALCYSNYNPVTHAEVSYDAYFNNCSFIVNNNYLGTETFHKHVVLVEVDGIDFSGCDFIADRSVNEVHPWCMGISSYDAGFSVTSPCLGLTIPCLKENMDYSTFVGLCSGICASGSGINPHTFMVRDVIFNNNDYGINVLNTNFPTILSNDFRIGGGGYCNYNYGVCLRNSTGFCIEENYFHPVPNPTSTTVGVAIYSSNGVNDVYLNDFEGLSRANLAFGDNTNGANSSVPMGPVQGLTYTCNEFTSNQRDIMVLKKNGIGDIQPQQGSAAVPAGNRFKNSTFQLYNDGYSPIDYHYNSNELYETPNTSMLYRVTPNGTTSTNVCSSHYGNNPVVKSPSEKAALEEDYLFAYSNYQGLHQQFEEHMDNDGTIAQLGVYAHGFSLAAGDIVRSNLFDSVANPSELRNWLRNMKDIAADRMAISSYIQEGDSVSAFALARMLPDLYHLQGDQLADHNDYVRLIKLYQSLRNSNRNVFQLNETEMNMVLRMAEEGTGISQSMAQVVIEKIRGRDEDACLTPELPNLGNGDKGGMMNLNADDDETSCLNVTLSPNPATTWTTINYSLPANVTKASLTITNSLGMNVYNADLEGAAGNKVIDLRGFAAGVYIYTIQYEQSIETGKMVITR